MLRTSGSSAGGIVFPIMLNRLFHGSIGFAWGVRISAFLVLGLLVIANLVMHPGHSASNEVSPTTPPGQRMQKILNDIPYMLFVLGYIPCIPITRTVLMLASFRAFCINWGIYFPREWLQSYATVM